MASKGEKVTLTLSIVSIISTAVSILSTIDHNIFGLISKYDSNTYTYFFASFLLISVLTAFISLIWILKKWKTRSNKKIKYISIILILPSLVLFVLLIIVAFINEVYY